MSTNLSSKEQHLLAVNKVVLYLRLQPHPSSNGAFLCRPGKKQQLAGPKRKLGNGRKLIDRSSRRHRTNIFPVIRFGMVDVVPICPLFYGGGDDDDDPSSSFQSLETIDFSPSFLFYTSIPCIAILSYKSKFQSVILQVSAVMKAPGKW